MHIVIAGGGEVGYYIARSFYQEGHDIAIIENIETAADRAETLDAKVVRGSAASRTSLAEAGIDRADLFVGVTSSDETNIIACALAKASGTRTIARINSEDFMTEQISTDRYKNLGIDVAICPDLVAAHRIVRALTSPTMLDADLFAGGRIQIFETTPGPNAPVLNRPIQSIEWPLSVNLAAILREREVIIPRGLDQIKEGDSIVIAMLTSAEVPALGALLDLPEHMVTPAKVEKVMIAGATRIGIHICRLLEGKADVTLIEPDEARCRSASASLTSTLVVRGTFTDKDLLNEEGISDVDAFVAATDRDGVNILACLLAKRLGARRVMSLLDEGDLRPYMGEIGIDGVTSPRLSTVSAILQSAHLAESYNTLYVLGDGDARVLEVNLSAGSKLVGSLLRRAKLPPTCLVAACVRRGEAFIPRGDFELEHEDKLIVFAKTEALPKLQKLL